MLRSSLISVGIAFSLCTASAAAVPNRITYQGRLMKSGINVAGEHPFQVCFVPSVPSACVNYPKVTLSATGDFTLLIDVPAHVDFFAHSYQLQLTVDGQALSPADDFTAVPYALVASTANLAVFANTAQTAGGLSNPLPASQVQLDGTPNFLSSWQSPLNESLIDGTKIQPSPTPSGTILPFAGVGAPEGFLICDGSAVSRTTYSRLFSTISTFWGAGDGSTTFNLPDLTGKTLFGRSMSGTFSTVGSTGGMETHSHTQAGHSHTANTHTHSISADGVHTHTFNMVGTNEGQGQWYAMRTNTTINPVVAHNHSGATGSASPGTDSQTPAINSTSNVPPFAVVSYIIKY